MKKFTDIVKKIGVPNHIKKTFNIVRSYCHCLVERKRNFLMGFPFTKNIRELSRHDVSVSVSTAACHDCSLEFKSWCWGMTLVVT